MSRLFFRLLFASCFLLSLTESLVVVTGTLGESITIQCRTSNRKEETLKLMKGLKGEEVRIMFKSPESKFFGSNANYTSRLQLSGEFPNLDIHMSNLTYHDISVYRCLYATYDSKTGEDVETAGGNSLLQVFRGELGLEFKDSPDDCKRLVLVAVGISSAVLIAIVLVLLVCIIKKKLLKRMIVVTHTGAEVYEEMRGTVRR